MFIVKPRGSKEIHCDTLELTISCAEDQAIVNGFVDIISNGRYLYTYYIKNNGLKVFNIKH